MGLRQLHTAETMFIDDGLTDGAVFPPSSNAVYDALQNTIELPSVTAEDNGDVLTVVSGAWAKATPSGGGVVSGTVTWNGDVVTLSMSVNEIISAIKDGEPVQFVDDYGSDENSDYITIYQVIGATKDDTNSVYNAVCMSYADGGGGVLNAEAYAFTASSADGNLSYDFS